MFSEVLPVADSSPPPGLFLHKIFVNIQIGLINVAGYGNG